MNHHEIAEQEIVERYVQQRLGPAERLAFQEHYFGCEECFQQVQTTARFIAGVRQAARAGLLDSRPVRSAAVGRAAWFRPAFAVTAFASLVLALALGWVLLSQIPRLRGDLGRERQAREQIERENQKRLAEANEALTTEKQQREAERARLQNQIELLAQNKPPALPELNRSQANSPLVILDTVRGSQSRDQELVLGSGSSSATIWIEVEAGNRFDSYRLQIFSGGQLLETITGAKPNSYGAVAVTVPARLLRPGRYVVKLSGLKGHEHQLVGEYALNVRAGK